MKQPMKKGSFVPKNVPGVGWGGWLMKGWGGVGWGGGGVMKGRGWGGSCRGGGGGGVKTQTQKIITHRVSKIHKWIQGDVYE